MALLILHTWMCVHMHTNAVTLLVFHILQYACSLWADQHLNLVLVAVGDRFVGCNLTEMNESGLWFFFHIRIRIVTAWCSSYTFVDVMCEHILEKVPN